CVPCIFPTNRTISCRGSGDCGCWARGARLGGGLPRQESGTGHCRTLRLYSQSTLSWEPADGNRLCLGRTLVLAGNRIPAAICAGLLAGDKGRRSFHATPVRRSLSSLCLCGSPVFSIAPPRSCREGIRKISVAPVQEEPGV